MWTRAELIAAGLDKSAITRRLRAKTLHRMYRNVYSVAPPVLLRPEARWRGAVLAIGEGAALSHRSAAALWELLDDRWELVDVTTPRRSRKGTDGIRLHRTRRLAAEDAAIVRSIRVTSVQRTLLDLADVVSLRVLRRAARQAEVPQLPVGSPRERARVEGRERDFAWGEARLVAEVDGHATHATRFAFEDDRARDLALVRAGWRVVRFTYAQITREPAEVAAALRDLLGLGPLALA